MKIIRILLLFVICVLWHGNLPAQANSQVENVRANTRKLEKAIGTDNEVEQAQSFYNLGKIHLDEKQWSRSETYFQLARDLFLKNGIKPRAAESARLLAQVQEQMQNPSSAIENYRFAAEHSTGQLKLLNQNDAARLSSPSMEDQVLLTVNNVEISRQNSQSSETVASLSQLAEVQVKQDNFPAAAENLENAYNQARKNDSRQAVDVNRQLVAVHKQNLDLDAALATSKKILEEDFAQNNKKLIAEQKQEIAAIYLQKQEIEQATVLLEESLEVAVENGYTLQVLEVSRKLDSIYQLQGDTQKSLDLHRQLSEKLPEILSNDESLVQDQVMKETELIISGLLKEKELNAKILKQQRFAGLGMLAVIAIMALLLILIFIALRKLRKRNLRIRLQSLKREMNPHFIFNSLNSINQFITTKDERSANQYLSRYSTLMRSIMENSTEDYIPLDTEIELLQNYLTLEKTRFDDQVNFKISVDEKLDTQRTLIPGMILQPFAENAIWHGIRYLNSPGNLYITFSSNRNGFDVIIKDDGIGIKKSQELKTNHQKQHKARGLANVQERIAILNQLYGDHIHFETIDSNEGVEVRFNFKNRENQ